MNLLLKLNTPYVRQSVFQLICLVGAVSFLGLFGNLYWFLDIVNHFRLQLILACFVLVLASSILQDKRSIALICVVAILNIGLLAESLYAFPYSKNRYEYGKLSKIHTIMFANVLTSNANKQRLADLINPYKPEIIVLTEVDDAWARSLDKLNADYPYRYLNPRSDNFGVAVLSKKPFEAHVYNGGEIGLPIILAKFESYSVLALHPLPPIGEEYAKENKAYLEKAATIIANEDKLIVAGDLNATLWSYGMHPLRGLGLQRSNRSGLAWTWPRGFFPLAVQIDHILSRNIKTGHFTVLEGIGSDHYPLFSIFYEEK